MRCWRILGIADTHGIPTVRFLDLAQDGDSFIPVVQPLDEVALEQSNRTDINADYVRVVRVNSTTRRTSCERSTRYKGASSGIIKTTTEEVEVRPALEHADGGCKCSRGTRDWLCCLSSWDAGRLTGLPTERSFSAGRLLKFFKAITESRIARVGRGRFGRKCAAWGIARGIWGRDASVRPRGRRRSRRGGGADRCLSGRSAVIRRTR